ncbi:COG1361 family protein [Micromonospora auratinigra]|uniref:hypothetical protein n=1 Tax=Micromonospora auratinigra TaxID=261654 RepID=UPI000B893164|nr:hypothetical protein [Micromonospora auratinigra]
MLVLLGAAGVPTASASAAPKGPDLTVDLVGGTIPLGVTSKTLTLRITNEGDAKPTDARVYVQVLAPVDDAQKVTLWPTGALGDCDGDVVGWYCEVRPEHLPGPGETAELPVSAGIQARQPMNLEIKASVEVKPNDVDPADNTRSFTVRVVDRPAADLSVVAPDVTKAVRVGTGGGLEPTGPLPPGGTGAVRYTIANQGLAPVDGVRVELHLPAGVTFTAPPGECVLGDAGRSAVCTYDRLALIPVKQDTDPDDALHSAVALQHLVTVSADTRAPVTLRGGTVRVEGLRAERPESAAPARAALPTNAVAVPAADVDTSDNQDGFAVVVAAKSSGGGTGNGGDHPGGGTGGSGGSGGGGLPVTGPAAAPVAGIGLALLVGGGVLLLGTRRRRTAGGGRSAG